MHGSSNNSSMNKTQSVLDGRRSTNNANNSSTSIPRAQTGPNGPIIIEKPPAKSVRDKSDNVRHKYPPHSIREPNKSASSSGVGMFSKDYSTAQTLPLGER